MMRDRCRDRCHFFHQWFSIFRVVEEVTARTNWVLDNVCMLRSKIYCGSLSNLSILASTIHQNCNQDWKICSPMSCFLIEYNLTDRHKCQIEGRCRKASNSKRCSTYGRRVGCLKSVCLICLSKTTLSYVSSFVVRTCFVSDFRKKSWVFKSKVTTWPGWAP